MMGCLENIALLTIEKGQMQVQPASLQPHSYFAVY